MQKILIFLFALYLLISLSSCKFFIWTGTLEPVDSYATHAEELAKKGNYKDAIKAYKAHIQSRLKDPGRAKSENPYFYYLMIGDLYLELNDFNGARDAYLTAKENGVSKSSISDRFIRMADWLVKIQQIEQAINFLRQFRELDPLLFDVHIDSLHKQMIHQEDKMSNKLK